MNALQSISRDSEENTITVACLDVEIAKSRRMGRQSARGNLVATVN
jgi:hypothetical protein